jgi:hypothetical protein
VTSLIACVAAQRVEGRDRDGIGTG